MERLCGLLNELLAETPVRVETRDFEGLEIDDQTKTSLIIINSSVEDDPSLLSDNPHAQYAIADAVASAAERAGLDRSSAILFGEWLGTMVGGWSTRFSETPVLELDRIFSVAAFNDPAITTRVYLAPTLAEFRSKVLAETQKGVAAVWQHLKQRSAEG